MTTETITSCSGLICWFDKHSGFSTAVLSFVLVLATIVYVWITYRLRKVGSEALIEARRGNELAVSSTNEVLREATRSRLDQQLPDHEVKIAHIAMNPPREPDDVVVTVRVVLRHTTDLRPLYSTNRPDDTKITLDGRTAVVEWDYVARLVGPSPVLAMPLLAVRAASTRRNVTDVFELPAMTLFDVQIRGIYDLEKLPGGYGPFPARREYGTE
jgi:hypothetical protein